MTVNNLRPLKILGFIYVATILVFIAISLHTWGADDDKYFSDALLNRSLFEFLNIRYHTWTGRILIEGIMVLTINHPWFFKFVIPLSLCVMAASLVALSSRGRKAGLLSFCLSLTLLLLINGDVMGEASWWVTGSYNYLQPIAAGLLSLAIFYYHRSGPVWTKVLALALLVFACFNEIYSILFAVPAIIAITYARKDYGKYSAIYFIAAALTTAFALTAPGNRERFYKETSRWFPDFPNFNIIDKVALGFDRLSSHITEQNVLLLVLMAVLVACIVLQKKNITGLQMLCMAVLAFKFALFFIFTRYSYPLKAFTHFEFLDFGNVADIKFFFPYVFSLFILFTCISLMTSICDSVEDLINMPVVFILGIASVVMMGLSPTVYASSFRVVFIFDLSVIYVILYMMFNKLPLKR